MRQSAHPLKTTRGSSIPKRASCSGCSTRQRSRPPKTTKGLAIPNGILRTLHALALPPAENSESGVRPRPPPRVPVTVDTFETRGPEPHSTVTTVLRFATRAPPILLTIDTLEARKTRSKSKSDDSSALGWLNIQCSPYCVLRALWARLLVMLTPDIGCSTHCALRKHKPARFHQLCGNHCG